MTWELGRTVIYYELTYVCTVESVHKEKGKEKGYVEANNSITSFVGSPFMGQ